MKRLFSIAIAAMLVGQAWAQTTFTSNGLKFTVTDNVNKTVSVSIDENNARATVNIPSTISYGNEDYTVTSIADYAFQGWTITSVVIPNTVISIGKNAFDECIALTSITIGNSVETIGDFAFISCAMTSITIPNSVISIGDRAFLECTAMTTISIGSSVASIGDLAFGFCSKLTEISVDSDNTSFASENGVLFNKDKTTLICCPSGKTGSYSIPGTVTTIGRCGFYDCRELTEVTLTDAVTAIGEFAFERCALLTITIPKDVETMGYNTFRYCDNIIIACIVAEKPDGWYDNWNPEGRPVVWGYKPLHYEITSDTTVQVVQSNDYKTMTGVLIPETVEIEGTTYTVTSIGADAFRYCDNLETLNFPKSVTEIGSNALYGCSGLTEINVYGDNQTYSSVDGVLFNKDKTVIIRCPENRTDTSYTIPNTVTDIQNGAFGHCRNLTEINIPNSVKHIGNFAFSDCTSLKGITIPEGITTIEGQTFEGCTSLSSVTIPQSVTEIDFQAFASCTSLESITIPSSVIKIASNAFRECDNLTSMNLVNSNYYSFENQTLFNKDKTELICYMNSAVTEEYAIPNTVTRIGDFAFVLTGISSVTIPESVTSIGSFAFSHCYNLTSITIPNSVTDIENDAIYDCENLESVILPESVKHLGGNFDGCEKLVFNEFDNAYYLGTVDNPYFALIKAKSTDITSCSINGNCKIIADDAFENCNKLTTIKIPESVTIIGQNAFANCSVLEYNEYDNAFYLGNNETQYLMLVKAKSKDITSCEINGDCQIIGEHAFDGCSQLSSITIPESVTSIGNHAFYDCSKLTTISIPNSVTYIGDYAFYGCSGLQLVSIPQSVTGIGEYAFMFCSNLVAVSVPKNVTSMGEHVFRYCSNLTLYCGAESKPSGWSEKWNSSNRPVVWNLGANVWLYTVNVKTNNNAYGSVSGGGIVANGSTTKITATPATGYKFVRWSNGLTNATATITVTKDTTLTAEFAIKTYTVSVAANNSSYGTVGGGGIVNHGSTTTITATPATGYKFVKWSNGLTNASVTVTVTKDTTLTAEFAIKTYTVTVAANNSSYGTVDGGGTVAEGSTTTITATPATGYKFVKWSNGSTNASETITVTSDLTLTAEFAFIIPEGNQEIPENPITETPADSTSFRFSILSSSEHKVEVSGYTGTSGNVVIPHKTTIDDVEYTVTAVGDQSFRNNNTIVAVTIPNTVTNIKSNAFRNCRNLEYVVIPSSVTTIGEGPFCERNSLTAIYVDRENKNFVSVDGVVYSADMKRLVQYPCAKPYTVFEIPNTVERIEYGAFSSCPNLESLIFPNSLENIRWWAICGCGNMKSFVIPKSVTTIGGNAIRNCKNLTIYCEAESEPSGWDSWWNYDERPVVWGYTSDLGDFTFNITSPDNFTVDVTGYSGSNANVLIPRKVVIEGDEYTVTGIASGAFLNNNTLTNVTIPEGVTRIAYQAFRNCSKLTSVVIPNSVTTIGGYAFAGCSNLTSVTIPAGVTSISERAFMDCSKLASVKLSEGLTSLADVAFYHCTSLTSLDLPSTVTSIGASSFEGCTGLTSIVIPEGTTSIGYKAFYNCAGLTSVKIPNTVTTIGYDAFWNCKDATIYCNLESKPEGWNSDWNRDGGTVVWNNKKWIVTLSANNSAYGTVEGGGTVENGTKITIKATPATGYEFVQWSNGSTNATETITVTSDVTLTAEFAEESTIPENPNDETAADSTNFRFDILSSTDHTAEVSGYYGTSGNVVIPHKTTIEGVEYTVTAVGDQAFRDNYTIVSVTIPNTVTNIKSNAFRCCKNLESVVIPSSVTTIGEGPFCESNSLTAIYVDEDNANFVSIDGVVYSTDMKRLVQYPCAKSDTAFVVPNGVERIEYGSFSSCPNLKSLVLSNTVKTIRWWAICGCGKMDSIVIPISVTSIESDGIRYCKNLTIYCEAESEPTGWSSAWNYDDRPVVWGYSSGNQNNNEETPDSDFTFKIIDNNSAEVTGYTGTETAITIPQKVEIDGNEYTVTSIGNKAFEGNDKLTAVVIPNTVTTIGDNAFSGCTELDSIVIPNSVENISSTAFVASEGTCGLTAQWRYDILTKTLTISGEGWLDGYGYDFNTHTEIKAPWAVYNDQMESVVVEEGITGLGSSMFSSSNVKYVSLPSTCNSFSSAFNMCRQLEKVIIRTRFVMSVNSSSFDNYDNCTLYVPMDLVDSYSKEIVFRDFSKVVGFYIITVDSEIKNGTVEVDKDLILENETFTITPTPDEGYVVGNVLVNDNPVENTNSVHAVGNDRSVILVSATFNKAGNGGNNEGVKPEDFTYGIISFSKMQVEIDGYNGTSTDIEIPKTVNFGGDEYSIVAIGDEAFKDCSILKSVTIPSTIKSVGDDAFSNCSSLESVTLPNTIEAIGACTFAECSSLKSIEIPNSVTFIGNSAFAESGLISVVIPNSVTEISSYAFQDCADLVSVEIPNSVESIGMSAFQNCSSLASVKIPSSVTNIGMSAFKGCRNASFECEAASKPDGWDESWNYDNRPVVWKNNAGTAVAESAANAVNIYAYGNTIVVENADAEIFVYDAMGRLVVEEPHFDVSTEIRINGTGVYLIKVGNTTKRVMIND